MVAALAEEVDHLEVGNDLTLKNMKKIKILIAILYSTCLSLVAQPSIPDPAGRWVIDDANIIDAGTENTISSLVQTHFDSTTNQVVVYTFNSLEGSTIEAYANEVYNKWNLGTKEYNNGVLLIIAYNDHKVRIEVGYGLEPYLTDLETQDIIQNDIVPQFKEGNYNEGILSGVQDIIAAINGTFKSKGATTNPFKGSWWMIALIFVLSFIGGSSKGCASYILLIVVDVFAYIIG